MKIEFETFRQFSDYNIDNMTMKEPSAFNHYVNVVKYKVTIEEVREDYSVIRKRLTKLWRECENHHHYETIMATAKRHGINLDHKDYGRDRK